MNESDQIKISEKQEPSIHSDPSNLPPLPLPLFLISYFFQFDPINQKRPQYVCGCPYTCTYIQIYTYQIVVSGENTSILYIWVLHACYPKGFAKGSDPPQSKETI